MKTCLTLIALLAFGFVGSLAWAQDEKGEAKKLRRIDPAEKSEAEVEKSPATDDLDARIAAIQDELRALDEKRRKLGRELRDLRRKRRSTAGNFRGLPGIRLRSMGSGQGLRIESGPEGVRVQISERNDQGEVETKTYEAESLEAFREEHPELAKRYGIGSDSGFSFGMDLDDFATPRGFPEMRRSLEELRERLGGMGGGLSGSSSPLPPQWPLAPRRMVPEEPRARLGVLVAPIDAERSEELSLESGEGLQVEEVQPQTLAARLGLKRGDILLTINGKRIAGAGTISSVLGDLEPTDKVTLEVERMGRGRQTLEAQKTARAKATKRI